VTQISQEAPAPSSLRRIVQRHPLTAFFVLSCVFSWWPGVLYLMDLSPLPIAGFGPFLAAVTVLGMTEGRAGIGRLVRSMLKWRVPKRAYLAAFGLPVLASGTAVLVNLALGADRPDAADIGLWSGIPVILLLVLLIPGLGGAWEEPGWRGYALTRLEGRFGQLPGPLLLGVLWVAWHLPLFLTGDILLPDVLVIIAVSVVIAAVFHSARESVLVAMLLHATNNAVGGSYASQLFDDADLFRLGLLTAAAWWLIAAAVIVHQRSSGDTVADRQPQRRPADELGPQPPSSL
jgi:membrane protease YdiL (CAAX protease family)